ncbi:MAG TPA: LuxR C-terminal-related transcriptional regulator [Streptosporangiaceae bacterium]|nr:LuxR C-terminal-related transcriptional regulator [Streptosporangiaceae bacterium]
MTTAISEPVIGRDGRAVRLAKKHELLGRHASDKLAVPCPSVPLLHRHRVSDLIQCATAGRVTLVCGPTGSGKTVACAMWATRTQSTGNVAWVSLDPGDRQPGRLWAHIGAALAGTEAMPDDLADALVEPAERGFGLRLADLAEQLDEPVTLVLDDVQELAGSEPLADLDLLVRHGPPNLRLMLAGRHLAGLGVAKLRVDGELAEIGADELACTPAEAQAYFDMLGVELPPDQLDELLGRTQGWITGLRLAALRSEAAHEPAAPWRISGDEPLVADYLRDEIMATLPAGRRLFLLQTCVVDRICGDLADTLTGSQDGAVVLDHLCRENVLVRRVEGGGGQIDYEYHPLLLDLLRAELRREFPGQVTELTGKAARWQARNHRPVPALKNAVMAGDWDFAATVLAQVGPDLLLPGQAAILEPILATFPASRYTADAAVAGALAAAGLRTGDNYATELHLRNAETALEQCPDHQRAVVAIWLKALTLMQATARGAADTGLIEQATAMAGPVPPTTSDRGEHHALGLLWTAAGIAALASLRISEARRAFAQAGRQLPSGPSDSIRLEFTARTIAWQAIAEAMYGDLRAADDLLADPILDAVAETDPLPGVLADLASACLHLARDETATARRLLDQCAENAGNHGWAGPVIWSLATMTRARLALCENDHGAARRLITKLHYQNLNPAKGEGRRTAPAPIGRTLAILDAEIALSEGNTAGAKLALDRASSDQSGGDRSGGGRANLLLTSAKILLADGDSRAALGKAEGCLTDSATDATMRDRVGALVLAAIACRRLGQTDQATDQLGYALTLAEPHREYRPFLDGGSAARSALAVLIRPASQGAATAARILQRFDTRPARPADAPAAVPLTGSELAVLRFLPTHMTNQEIAEALFLSINTVKTHLRSVYRKLGVTTRRQAISTAARLGLL